MGSTFAGCKNLTGTVVIHASPSYYMNCFFNTAKPIVLTGSSTVLNELAATASEGNVTVG
jgi:L-asparaginase/Glu-tRNA(Gln) amidotransferase subunit D